MLGAIAWISLQTFGPSKSDIDPVRKRAGQEVISQIISDLQANRKELRRVALLQFDGDGRNWITEGLRSKIEFMGVFDLEPKGLQGIEASARGQLNLRQPSYGTIEKAVEEGKSLGAKGVIFGNVRRFESVPGGAALDIEVTLCEVGSGKVVFTKTYKRDDSTGIAGTAEVPVSASGEAGGGGRSWFTRGLVWLLIVLLLPVSTVSFIRTMVGKRSNKVNAFVLFVYTLSDAVLACLLVGAMLTSWPGGLLVLAMTALALVYNLRIMSCALELES